MAPGLLRGDRRFTKYKSNIFTEQGINSNNLVVLQSPMCFPTYLWSHSNNVLEHSTLSKRKIKEFIYMEMAVMPVVSVLSRAMNIIDMGEGLYYVFFEGVDHIGMS